MSNLALDNIRKNVIYQNSIDIWTVVVPTIPGRVHSQEWVSETGWDQVPKQIVRLNTETELKGIGETARGVDVEIVAKGASLLIGRDPETIALRNIFRGRVDGSEDMVREADGDSSYDAFEMAVLDLVGHLVQVQDAGHGQRQGRKGNHDGKRPSHTHTHEQQHARDQERNLGDQGRVRECLERGNSRRFDNRGQYVTHDLLELRVGHEILHFL